MQSILTNQFLKLNILITISCFCALFTKPIIAAEAPINADVRVLVDISGSMKKNDPKNLRVPAIQMMSSILPPDAQAGVWTFGQYVNMLVPLSQVNAQWKSNAVEAANKINSLGLYTNIGGAMEKASFGWDVANSEISRSLILLTDGVVDVSKDPAENAAARRKVLRELLPKFKAAGITIHTIALSGDADENLLSKMASETDGWYQKVENASELQKVFLKIFEQATARDAVPLIDNRFNVDSAIDEFTLLIFKTANSRPTQLEQPDGELYDAGTDHESVKWFESESFDLITVDAPQAGEWRVYADIDPDNRVLVVSDLKLKSAALPNNLLANESFDVALNLEQEGTTINEPNLLSLVKFEIELTDQQGNKSVHQLFDNGQSPDQTAGDGIYSATISAPSESGITDISAWAESPTFQRMRKQAINVFDSPVRVRQELSEQLDTPHKILFNPIDKIAIPDSLEVTATALMPNGQVVSKKAERERGYTLGIDLPVFEQGGNYTLNLSITGETPAGRQFKVSPPPTIIVSSALVSQPEQQPEPEPEQPAIEDEVETAPEQSPEQEDEVTDAVPEEQSEGIATSTWVYIGLGVNLLLAVLGWFIFKMVKKRNLANAKEFGDQLG